MTRLEAILQKQIAIFTCMDTRLVDFLEPAMGLKRGEAKVIKNAGNTIVDPLSGAVIRSLVAGIFMLGVEEVFVIGHKDCGMAEIDSELVKRKMVSYARQSLVGQLVSENEGGVEKNIGKGRFPCFPRSGQRRPALTSRVPAARLATGTLSKSGVTACL